MEETGRRGRPHGRPRGRALLCATAVTIGSAIALAPAAASASAYGSLAITVHSAVRGAVHISVDGKRVHRSISVHTRAGSTVHLPTLRVPAGAYRVVEHTGNRTVVKRLTVTPSARVAAKHVKAGWVRAGVVRGHTTRVSFVNGRQRVPSAPAPVHAPRPTPPSAPAAAGNGYLEVCKAAGDGWVNGSVTVHITAGATRVSQVVPVGQCTAAIQVPAGTATVSETVAAPFHLAKAVTMPSNALLSTDLVHNSVRVQVAQSTDQATETLVTLVNATSTGYVKICKTLTSNAGDLITNGQNAFTFGVGYTTSRTGPVSSSMTVVVPTLGQAACVIYPTPLPLGTQVQVTEQHAPNTTLQSVVVAPSSQLVSVSGSTATLTVGPNANGITAAMFTNSADGTIEICKTIDDTQWNPGAVGQQSSPYDGTPFQFSVNGGQPITVLAGACSPAISVPAGRATVNELTTPNFHLVGMTAQGPRGEDRRVSGTNPMTVLVPAGGVGNETLVTATNAVDTARVKICKQLGPNVPVGKTFTFTTNFRTVEALVAPTIALTPTATGPAGEACTYLTRPIPVITPSGTAVAVTVTEGKSPFGTATSNGKSQLVVEPTDIAYDGNGSMLDSKIAHVGDPVSYDGTYYATAQLGYGINEITFTNSLVLDP